MDSEGINLGRGTASSDAGMYPLRTFIEGSLLGGPASVSLEGAPPLTLDPKEKQVYTPGTLR